MSEQLAEFRAFLADFERLIHAEVNAAKTTEDLAKVRSEANRVFSDLNKALWGPRRK